MSGFGDRSFIVRTQGLAIGEKNVVPAFEHYSLMTVEAAVERSDRHTPPWWVGPGNRIDLGPELGSLSFTGKNP